MKKLSIVEVIRGIAALSVCLFHFRANILASGLTKFDHSGFLNILINFFDFGHLGVIAFFVLSGFILPYSMLAADYEYNNLPKFLLKRCIRIEPPYLISVIVAAGLFYVSTRTHSYRGEPFSLTWGNFLAHVGYLPEHLGYKWIQPVYWTLEAEFHFYILIALALPLMWRNAKSLLLFIAFALLLSFFIRLYVFEYMPFFAIGIITCAKKKQKVNSLIYYVTILASASMCLYKGYQLWMPVTGILTSFAILYLSCNNKLLQFLGSISFSLYLLHVPLGGRLINLFSRFVSTEWQVYALLLVTVLFTIGAAYLFYILVEKRSLKWSKRISYKHSYSKQKWRVYQLTNS